MKKIIYLFLMTLPSLLSACGTLASGGRWGEDATLAPGWPRVGHAALNAVASPKTWVPVAGAIALQIGHTDQHLASWASEHTPIFGSNNRANEATTVIGNTSDFILYTSILATPSGDDSGQWLTAKAKGAAVDLAALTFTKEGVKYLKDSTRRQRPDGSDYRSFPSGHSSGTSLNSTLAYYNIQSMNVPEGTKAAAGYGLTGLSILGAWGRVEAGVHYPSDVLMGLAIGHAVGVFFQDAFLGLDSDKILVEAAPLDQGFLLSLSWRY